MLTTSFQIACFAAVPRMRMQIGRYALLRPMGRAYQHQGFGLAIDEIL